MKFAEQPLHGPQKHLHRIERMLGLMIAFVVFNSLLLLHPHYNMIVNGH
jgi:hypothetical protein